MQKMKIGGEIKKLLGFSSLENAVMVAYTFLS